MIVTIMMIMFNLVLQFPVKIISYVRLSHKLYSTSISIFHGLQWSTPTWPDNSTGRALHRYHKGHGSNLIQAWIFQVNHSLLIKYPSSIKIITTVIMPTLSSTFNRSFSNSLIIHEEKTKEITTVKEVWICDPNYHKIRRSFALIFSKNYQCFEKLYQTLERVFHQVSKHFEVG